MSKFPNPKICFEYPINSNILIDFFSYKELFVTFITPEKLVFKDVPLNGVGVENAEAKISITIKRNTPLEEDQLLGYLKEAQVPIEEFNVFVLLSTTVDKSKVKYKK